MASLGFLCRELVARRGAGAIFRWKDRELPASLAAEDFMPVLLRQAARTMQIVCPGHERTLVLMPARRGRGERFHFTGKADPAIWLPAVLDALECAAETPEERSAREMQLQAQDASHALDGMLSDEPAPAQVFVLDRIDPPRPELKGPVACAGGLAEPAFAAIDCLPEAESCAGNPDDSPGEAGGRH